MFKLLIYGVLFYLAYRLFIKPLLLQGPSDNIHISDNKKEKDHDDEYIDYEEIK